MPTRISRPTLLAGLTALALLALPEHTLADTGREARLTVAQAYVGAMLEDVDIDEMVRAMYRPVLDQVRAGGQDVSDAQEAEIEALYLAEMSGPMRDLIRSQDEIMADLMTLSELEALYDFYQTSAGRNVLLKLPRIVEAQMPATMQIIEDRMEVILPQMMEILD